MNAEILEQATEYFIDFSQGDVDAAGQEQFDQWLRRSPEHVRAYLQVTALWEDASALGKSRTLASDELVARALRESNVVPLKPAAESAPPAGASPPVTTAAPARKPLPRSLLAAAASVLLAAFFMWFYFEQNVYRTGIGEQRSIALEDGSTIDLNSRSRVRVRYSNHERRIELLEGQGLFQVAKDSERPFIVQTQGTQVRAVGTQFDVYQKPTTTLITVIEGHVAVLPNAPEDASGSAAINGPAPLLTGAPGEILLAAGEQLDVRLAQVRAQDRPQPADVDAATAWTRRQIVFNATPLSEVIEEFNRYNTRQLSIADGDIKATRISGVFSSTDPNSLVRFLAALPTIRVETEGDEIRILAKVAAEK